MRRPLIALLTWLMPATVLSGGEWPQILGPGRDGVARSEQLLDPWPEKGPPLEWERPVGQGYAGVAVARGRIVLFHRVEDEDIVEALAASSGKLLWKSAFPTRYRPSIDSDGGPRAVPIVADEQVYVYGADGTLRSLDLADGHPIWSRSLLKEMEGREGYFGAGTSPLVEGDRLLVNVGGRGRAGLVAISRETGKTIWKTGDEQASYSSPVATTLGTERHVVFVTRFSALSIDPAEGRIRFRVPFGRRGPTVSAANPVVIGKHVLLTASYGVGARLLRIEGDNAETVWSADDVLSSQYVTPVLHDGVLYGIHGRADVGRAALRAIDPVAGKVLWSEPDFGMASLIVADGRLLVMKTDGHLIVATPSRSDYRPLSRARLVAGTARALPAVANGRLFVRDEKLLRCYRIGRTSRAEPDPLDRPGGARGRGRPEG